MFNYCIDMPDREAVILEDITGEGVLAELHPIQFKEDIDNLSVEDIT